VIIVTYDENGGFWDHVPPPRIDAWGPGTRVPAIVISPFAKQGFIDHTTYDTTSITATIEHRWVPRTARNARRKRGRPRQGARALARIIHNPAGVGACIFGVCAGI
jgi:phospholipase C